MENLLINGGGEKPLKLEGEVNWISWKFQLKVILRAMQLFEVTDGTSIFPVDGTQEEKEAWLRKDANAQSVLVTRLTNRTLTQVTSCETAREIWEKLEAIYELKSDGSLHLMQQSFFDLRFTSSDTMASFIGRVEHIVTQIRQLDGDVSESMVLTKIIASLPGEYRHFASAWDSTQDEKRTLNELTARLLTEEQRVKEQTNELKEALMVKRVNQRKCFKCGKTGHFKRDCRSNKTPNIKHCNRCNKNGHTNEECWSKNRNIGRSSRKRKSVHGVTDGYLLQQ